MNYTTACAVAPKLVPSDAGISGIGILCSFIAAAIIAMILSIALVACDIRNVDPSLTWNIVLRRVLNAYSDQQLLQGIAIQGLGLARMDAIIPYHFFLIWMISLLSIAVHNASLIALVQDYRRDPVLRWFRQVLMAVNLLLSCASGIFVLEAVQDGINNSTLPIFCVWSPDPLPPDVVDPPSKGTPLSFIGTIIVIAGNVLVFGFATFYLQRGTKRYNRVIQILGLLVMLAIAIGATIRMVMLADAFGINPPLFLSDDGERKWTYGQLFCMVVLIYPLITIIEVYRGAINCPAPVPIEEVKLLDPEGAAAPEEEAELQEVK